MSEDNKNEDQKYNLYTEHIVPEKSKKIKQLAKKGGTVLGTAVIFGLIAGLVMIIVYRTGSRLTEDETSRQGIVLEGDETTGEASGENNTSHEDVTIKPAETTTESPTSETQLVWDESVLAGLNDISGMYGSLKNVVNRVGMSSVTVTVSNDGVDWFNSSYQSVSDDYGIIIAADTDSYYILTDYSLVMGAQQIAVTFANGMAGVGTLMAGDSTTGMAVVRTPIIQSELIRVASLGDSGAVGQGDIVVAVGKLYGFVSSMGYGIATGINNTITDTDSFFSLINTDIAGTETSSGIIANLNGEIIGVVTTGYNTGSSNLITAYSISDIKNLIQNLCNGKASAYLGIKGQEVTEAIKNSSGVPEGIYVAAVESGSPAYAAGIQTGDVIALINGRSVRTAQQFEDRMTECKPGDTVSVSIRRKGRDSYKEIEFNITLGVE